jgi:DNA helicase IV
MPPPQAANSKPYEITILARLFASHSQYQAIAIEGEGFLFKNFNGKQRSIDFMSVESTITTEYGWFWDVLVFQLGNEIFRFGGIDKAQSNQLQTLFNHLTLRHIENFYQKFKPVLKHAALEASHQFSGKKYIRSSAARQWMANYKMLSNGFLRKDFLQHLSASGIHDYKKIAPFLNDNQHIPRLNQSFVEQQTLFFKDFFDHVESNPLTEQQRRACVIDEQHNLILAGAGTGKTSTMIGRAGYLVKAGLAKPEQILMLAYARKAAEEMDQRIHEKLKIKSLTVKTFHSLGMNIIAKVEGAVPSIHKMAEDELYRASFVDDQLSKLLEDEFYKPLLINYLVNLSYPYRGQHEFQSLGEYSAYIRENDIRTLQGELVKSYEECEIANFLFRQGVTYEYEANYKINTSGPDFKAYQPDFYLPDYDIYIEHFAVNAQNQTPSFIDQQSYLSGMEWKRGLHHKNKTTLIETYSYLKQQRRLTDALSEKLIAANVEFNPLRQDELLEKLNEIGRVSDFSQLMAKILVSFKSTYLNIQGLIELATPKENAELLLATIQLFEPIFKSYQQELLNSKSIDFEDMIGRAIDYVESGRYQSNFEYLLVDEFQDISASRARLLKSLMAQQPSCSLFCVGDDWQSIYRFTGSDVSITKDFESNFGDTVTSILDKTFRFNSKIGEVASRFVTENPHQIKKTINSHRKVEHKAVSLIKTNQVMIGLDAALSAISAKATDSVSVLLLGRFKFKKPSLGALKRQHPKIKIEFMTVHASKGKEADYVVVLGLEKGEHGFPSEKATHPLLEFLLPKAEDYEYAEERRLFYVSLTRAKHHVYLIADGNNPSNFIREMVTKDYPILMDEFTGEGFQDKLASIPCVKCKTGYMVARDGQYGSFFGCSNFPLCNHTQRACQWCGGGLLNKGRFRVCESPRCDFVDPICPQCGGSLTLRKGKFGQFWGCSNYRSDAEFSCGHKEKYIDLQAARSDQ